MNMDSHERAQDAIARRETEGISHERQVWLDNHLSECPACREYESATRNALSAWILTTIPPNPDLVRMTKIHVRIRAAELESQEQRVWLAVALFLFAGILTSLTTPLVWQVFDWMGMRLGETMFVSQTSFVLFWIAPGLIVGGILALSPKPEAIVSTLENKYEK